MPTDQSVKDGVRIEFLKSGKLVSGPDQRVPRDQGYAITRRSVGIGRYGAAPASKDILGERLDIMRIDAAADRGVFVLRCAPRAATAQESGVVMMRARFVSEAGTEIRGRTFEQAEFWIADRQDWLRWPGLVLGRAATDLKALTDAIEEPEEQRLRADPIVIEAPATRRAVDGMETWIEEACDGSVALLHYLLSPELAKPAGQLDLGTESFASEEAFLAKVADALTMLSALAPGAARAGLAPRRDGVPDPLAKLVVVTGYAGRFGGLGHPCVTYRDIALAPAQADRDGLRTLLAKLYPSARTAKAVPAGRMVRATAAVVQPGTPTPRHGGTPPSSMPAFRGNQSSSTAHGEPGTVRRFRQSFHTAAESRTFESVRSLVSDTQAVWKDQARLIETRDRDLKDALGPAAWRFLVGFRETDPEAPQPARASFLSLWTVFDFLLLILSDGAGADRAMHCAKALQLRIDSQTILVPEELRLVDSLLTRPSDGYGASQADVTRIAFRWFHAHVLGHGGEAGPSSLEVVSRSLAHWLDAPSAPDGARHDAQVGATGAPRELDEIMSRLVYRFGQATHDTLDWGINARFTADAVPAMLDACFRRTLGPAASETSPSVVHVLALTRSMMDFIRVAPEVRHDASAA